MGVGLGVGVGSRTFGQLEGARVVASEAAEQIRWVRREAREAGTPYGDCGAAAWLGVGVGLGLGC